MDNYERLQLAARNISKLIRFEKAWREGQYEVDGEIVVFNEEFKTRIKQKFAAIRTETIAALNGIVP